MHRWRSLLFVLPLAGALAIPAQAGLDTQAEHAVLMDAASGQILWDKAGDVAVPPASMSKLMTIEMLFERLKDGRLKLSDTFTVSHNAHTTYGSRMFLKEGSQVKIEDLIRGIVIQSGNDAAVTVAEGIGGTVDNFVKMMNARAKVLGLKNSHFVNPDGLPDPPGQLMSVDDLATLARHLIDDYPQYYHYFGEKSFTWSNIKQPNRNFVIEKFKGADGLKTGFTDDAGYGLVTSAKRGNERLILVLAGLRYPDLAKYSPQKISWIAENRRADEAARVLTMAFREYRSYPLFKADQVVDHVKVFGGNVSQVGVITGKPVKVILPVEARKKMQVKLRYVSPVTAPLSKGMRIGTMTITAPGVKPLEVPLFTDREVKKAGFFGRIWMGIQGLIHH